MIIIFFNINSYFAVDLLLGIINVYGMKLVCLCECCFISRSLNYYYYFSSFLFNIFLFYFLGFLLQIKPKSKRNKKSLKFAFDLGVFVRVCGSFWITNCDFQFINAKRQRRFLTQGFLLRL